MNLSGFKYCNHFLRVLYVRLNEAMCGGPMIYANGFIFNVYNENFFEYLKRVVNNATYDMTDEVFDVLVNEMNENFIEYIVNWLYSDMFIRSSWGQDHKAKLLKKCKCCFECFLERTCDQQREIVEKN